VVFPSGAIWLLYGLLSGLLERGGISDCTGISVCLGLLSLCVRQVYHLLNGREEHSQFSRRERELLGYCKRDEQLDAPSQPSNVAQ